MQRYKQLELRIKIDLILNFMRNIPHNPEEIIALVDENDNVIGGATRGEVHKKGLLHREVYIYIVNSKGQVLLQKRKDVHLWDHSASGHFPKKQNYRTNWTGTKNRF